MTDFLEDLKGLISKQFAIPIDEIEEESLLDEDLSVTDLDLEDLMVQIQKKYEIEIPQEKLPSFKKVGDIVSYLYENIEPIG